MTAAYQRELNLTTGNIIYLLSLIKITIMQQVITFKEKNVYGRVLIYPVCDKANIFSGLLSTKTFTTGQLSLIESLGYTVNLISL
jgi:hypothetical protein